MKVEIVFRSGTTIQAEVEEFTIGKAPLTGEIRELHWVSPAAALRRLKHVNLSEIAAILVIHESGDADEGPADKPEEPS